MLEISCKFFPANRVFFSVSCRPVQLCRKCPKNFANMVPLKILYFSQKPPFFLWSIIFNFVSFLLQEFKFSALPLCLQSGTPSPFVPNVSPPSLHPLVSPPHLYPPPPPVPLSLPSPSIVSLLNTGACPRVTVSLSSWCSAWRICSRCWSLHFHYIPPTWFPENSKYSTFVYAILELRRWENIKKYVSDIRHHTSGVLIWYRWKFCKTIL